MSSMSGWQIAVIGMLSAAAGRSSPARARGIRYLLVGLGVAGILGAATAAAQLVAQIQAAPVQHLANADDDPTVERGKRIYRTQCAACHGRNLQGQPLWQLNDEHAAQRAPAHDETGHTWQHSDEAIFEKVKYGRFDAARTDLVSYMPAFRDLLSDADILAVMAFIKRRWPLGLRVSQAMLNPNYAGMPPDADRVEWRLPPTCVGGMRRASSP
jgi:mono/diheme cytochrome c family protein